MSKLLVVTPTYNEAENLEVLAQEVFTAMPEAELLVVDDNSPDGTGDLAERLAKDDPRIHVLHREKKEGLGRAYVDGFKWALARDYAWVVQMDADLSHNPQDLPRLKAAAEEADLVIGSRYIGKSTRVVDWPLHRLMLSYGAGMYVRLFTRLPVMDPTGGFKLFRREVLEGIDLEGIAAEGYGFQIEVNHKAWRKGFRLKEIPIVFTDRQRGVSKLSLAIAREAICLVLRLAFH